MSAVGLFYVGAVLFINGLMLLGRVTPRSAGVFNLFVGGLQCVIPLMIVAQSGGDHATLHATFPILLFGFTYLYVGITNLTSISAEGVGWFSLFVSASAVYFALDSIAAGDLAFGVVWLAWSVLWFLFFALLALEKAAWTPFSGWLVTLWAIPTTSVPAVLFLRDAWVPGVVGALGMLVALGILALIAWILAKRTPVEEHSLARSPEELAGQST
ncbi:transporter [Nesterenkonia sp. AY15]|uniref:AmiS/UreI family transporter n=1 Tax=Nesterenkonia sp. AY15 TaxID=2901139 RepID=UPI001F4C9416|nr:transporter [Nesterenkonia sp. AY15]